MEKAMVYPGLIVWYCDKGTGVTAPAIVTKCYGVPDTHMVNLTSLGDGTNQTHNGPVQAVPYGIDKGCWRHVDKSS